MTSIVMGAVKDSMSGIANGVVEIGKGAQSSLKLVKNHKHANSIAKNSVGNFNAASKLCPIVNQG